MRTPSGNEMQVYGEMSFDQSGAYTVINNEFNTCEIQVKVVNK
ncbi:hypothetical protein [Bdellovibrio sp.]